MTSPAPATIHAAPTAPSPQDVQELIEFLAANVDVSRIDGLHDKVERYAAFLGTVKALAGQSYQYVIVSLHRIGDGLMEPGATWGPYSSKELAQEALNAMSFPSPEWVHIRRLHTRSTRTQVGS